MVDRKSAAAKKKAPARQPASRQPAAADSAATKGADVQAATAELAASSTEPVMETIPVDPGQATPSAAAATSETAPEKPVPAKGHHSAAIKRVLDIFLVDSGWNNPVCAAVHDNIPAVASYLTGHRFFVMSHEQSRNFIQRHPALIGADPILMVLDRQSATEKNPAGCGFRLSLGHIRQPEVAISMLKWAVQLTMTSSTAEMSACVKKSGQRETLQGVIELMGEGSAHLLEFAPV